MLKNIQKFVDKFNIIIQPHHKLWEDKHFDFPTEKKLVDVVLTNELIQNKKIKHILELQKDIIKLDINNDMVIDSVNEYSDNNGKSNNEDDFPNIDKTNKKKRKKRGKNKIDNNDINKMRNTDEEDSVYEIESIKNHKIKDNEYVFLVKWVGYSEDNNSWVNEKDLFAKTLLKEYMNSKQIKY